MGKGSNTTTQTTAPNPDAMRSYMDLMARSQSVASSPYVPYGGELVAPVNAQQQAGVGNINNFAGWAQPYYQHAADLANSASQPISGEDIQHYQNPYIGQVVDATQRSFDNANKMQLQNVKGNAIAQGALGGDREAVAESVLSGQQRQAQDPIIAGLYSRGYDTALNTAVGQQQNRGNLAYTFGNLGSGAQTAGLTGANAQVGAGSLYQGTQQAEDQARLQQFLAQQAFPYQQTQWLAGIDTGVGSQMGGTSTTTPPPPNPWSTIAGLGVAGLGAYGGAGGFKSAYRGGRIPGFAEGGMPYGAGPQPYAGGVGYIPAISITGGRGAPAAPGGPNNSTGQGGGGSSPMSSIGSGLGKMFGSSSSSASTAPAAGGGAGNAAVDAAVTPTASEVALGSESTAALTGTGAGAAGAAGLGAEGAGAEGVGAGIGAIGEGGAEAAGAGVGEFAGEVASSPGFWESLAEFLPFLAALKRGGRIPGFDEGGPVLAGFGTGSVMPAFDDPLRDSFADRFYSGNEPLRDNFADRFAGVSGNQNSGVPSLALSSGQQNVPQEPVAGFPFADRWAPVDAANDRYGAFRPPDADDPNASIPASATPAAYNAPAGVAPTVSDAGPGAPTGAGTAIDMGTPPPPSTQRRGGFGDLSPAAWQGIMAAGLGMMASRSPHLGSAIGEGGLTGLHAYAGAKQQESTEAHQRSQDARMKEQTAVAVKKLGQDAESAAARLKEQTRQHDEIAGRPVKIGENPRTGAAIMGVRDPKNPGQWLDPVTNSPINPGMLGSANAPGTPAATPEEGIIPANARLVQGGAHDYTQDAPYIEKGMDVPAPQTVAGRSARSVQTDAEYYLQTGKLPPVRSGKSPVAIAQQDYRNSVQNYGNAVAQSRGLSPEQMAEMWRTAPGMLRFVLGADGRSTVALGTAVRHLDTLAELAKAWGANDTQAINRIRAVISRQFGSDAATNLETAGKIIGPEIIKAIGVAGAGTAEERQAAQQGFGAAASPAQMFGAITTTQKLLGGQLEGRKRQAANAGVSEERFKSLIGERPYEILSNAEKGGQGPPAPGGGGAKLPAADRFNQLTSGGMSKADAYKKMHEEGY